MKKRIVIIDDHPIVRQGFAQLIDQEDDLTVIGEAEDAPSAMDLVERCRPDLALVDLSLKNSNGIELIKNLTQLYPGLLMLVISLHDESVYAERALRAGARGFIMKAEATENVMTAIRPPTASSRCMPPRSTGATSTPPTRSWATSSSGSRLGISDALPLPGGRQLPQ